jgi:hypothetical protein
MKNKILKITFKKAIFMCAAILIGGFFMFTKNALALVIFDFTPPSVSITSPSDGISVNGTITISADATDEDSGINRVEFWQSDIVALPSVKIDEDITSPYSTSWDTTSVNDGTYYILAKAFNGNGNFSLSSYITIIVNNNPPVLHLPSDMNVTTNSLDGAIVNYAATATDANPKKPAVTCDPVSGSTFAVGATKVNCSATDAEGMISEGSFNVTVNYVAPAVSENSSSGFSTTFNSCTDVVYGDWGECINGIESRDITSQSPSLCDLTLSQLAGKSRSCESSTATSTPEITNQETSSSTSTSEIATSTEGEVLGVKAYANGSLLRSLVTKKIYYIINGQKKLVRNLAELWQYRLAKRIDVSEEILAQYPDYTGEVLGAKTYPNGSLLRSLITKKIYYITDGQKKHIRTLVQLWQYKNLKIINVSEEVLAQYPDVAGEVLGAKTYPDGSLLRSAVTKKIYYIINGEKKFITSGQSWNYGNLLMTNIIEVGEEVLAQYPNAK